jgi:hypothetical protein
MEITYIPADDLDEYKLIAPKYSRHTFKLKRKCRLRSEWVKPRTPSVISVRSYGCEESETET